MKIRCSHKSFFFSIPLLCWLLSTAAAAETDNSQRLDLIRSQPGLPVVTFQVETAAGEAVAHRCAAAWRQRGPQLTAAIVPERMTADSVMCLILGTSTFQNYFAGRLPDWGVGAAVPSGRVVAIDIDRQAAVNRSVEEVFLHEMVHALLFQSAAGAWMPVWFHEGVAMWLSGEWRFIDTVSIVLGGNLPSLDRLQGRFPQSVVHADLAYRTSMLAVGRLRESYGEEVIGRLVRAAARTGDFETAFVEVTGDPLRSFVSHFAADMQLKYGWLLMLARWPTLFVLMAIVFLIGGTAKIVRSRRRLAEMDEEESTRYH